jgi:uncharacterized protein (TIGR00369 family)
MTTTNITAQDLESQGWRRREPAGFAGLVGPLWTRQGESGWCCGILAGTEHLNPAGVVHGGLLMSLLDHALSTIAWTAAERRVCVTVQMDTQFLSSARAGRFLLAQGRVARATSSLVFMNGRITVDDRDVCTGSSILKILQASP